VTRIASVKPHPISVPLKDPVWTAHEELTSSSVIVVEVRTDDGLTGYGQIHGSPMKAICTWVERFGEIVRGMDALAHVAVWDRLFSLTCPRPGGIAGADGLPPPLPRGERPQIMAAIGGIDIALWDIKGKHAAASRARFRPTRREATTVPERRTRSMPRSSQASCRPGIAPSS
jgi:L-alanine-DL-glutamate epimerase-like enolase superfamily enzyme